MGPEQTLGKARQGIYKNIWVAKAFGSEEFYSRLNKFYARLVKLHSKKIISSSPSTAMSVVDALNKKQPLPAKFYGKCLFILPKSDREAVDRLLREDGIVEATVVFKDDSFIEAGIETGVDYSNNDLIKKIFEPCSSRSFDLVDPAIYARLVPGENLFSLFSFASSIRTALLGVLWALTEMIDNEGITEKGASILTQYNQRDPQARQRDAETMVSLIAGYAVSKDIKVNAVASRLTDIFQILFNEKEYIPSLTLLKKRLEDATFKSGSYTEIRRLVARLDEKISRRKKGLPDPPKTKQSGDDQYRIVGYEGWKAHQK